MQKYKKVFNLIMSLTFINVFVETNLQVSTFFI